jgi:hypothetical protein
MCGRRCCARLLAAAVTLAIFPAVAAIAAAPLIYSQAAFESPVRGEPDDLLMLPGSGFSIDDRVVYQATDDGLALAAPNAVPDQSSPSLGIASIVSSVSLPLALTVRLPADLLRDRPYALWVVNRNGEWSNGVKINDMRPLWLSPGYVYSTADMAHLPRYLKIVGRNLTPRPDAVLRVRLLGPATFERAGNRTSADVVLSSYRTEVALPDKMPAGDYRVDVSRDGKSWISIADQTLRVEADPVAQRVFEAGDVEFGACHADDGQDDTACVERAVLAAGAAGGGTVHLGPGTWVISEGANPSRESPGLVLGLNVNLVGAGARLTTVIRRVGATGKPTSAAFTLLGHNIIEGIHFRDAAEYGPRDAAAPMLRLGVDYASAATGLNAEQRRVDDIVITRNVFDRTHPAISGDGLPIRRLLVTYNEFGSYDFGLIIRGDRFNAADRFQIEDSVFAYNRFEPGSYLDLDQRQGAIASQLGAARRVDFSHNIADGASGRYLYHDGDARGWRAGFFWNLTGAAEMLLVSQNTLTCTGDKDGDGEAIALDNDGNTFGFGEARDVISASRHQLTVQGQLRALQNRRQTPSNYYHDHYVQIVAGVGLGQTRRIRSYRIDREGDQSQMTVAPDWDVPPGTGSRAVVGRQFWQTYIVSNEVDQRRPLCRKSNRTLPKGGVIGIWAQAADSSVAGNRQFDTDGIITNQNYNAENPACPTCDAGAFIQFFVDIRSNLIDGEYDWNSDCSHSGIYLAHSAAATPDSAPPTVSYGVSVAHNTIRHADGLRGGGIVVPLTWEAGPPPHRWPLVSNLLIQHNDLQQLSGPPPQHRCDNPQSSRIGINLYQADMVRGTVLYANACRNVDTPLHDGAVRTVRVCPNGTSDSCECRVSP